MTSPSQPADGTVLSVARSGDHHFSKELETSITLLKGLGVEGDAHLGVTVQHLSRVGRDPTQPNLRQVHLIHSELFEELAGRGFDVRPGDLGENVLTRGVDLLGLPEGTRLHIGASAVVEVTGLRNPCVQIDDFQKGLMHALLDHDADGNLVRKSGVMSVVLEGGDIAAGDAIRVELPPEPHRKLDKV
ncbi:MOSC domain-containing protein [Terrihabitans sp. B22-R8]|uniref:MOSC domain-containing protein n=1 Tax=Terrihabitans sp. B22-R8 TaxID=3425128 RepID=UPI00403CE9FD